MDIVTRPGFWNIPVWAIIAILCSWSDRLRHLRARHL